jgi:hypothetical protein
MKVKEMIEALSKFDGEKELMINYAASDDRKPRFGVKKYTQDIKEEGYMDSSTNEIVDNIVLIRVSDRSWGQNTIVIAPKK